MFSILLTFNTLKILTFAFLCKYFFKIINRTQVITFLEDVSSLTICQKFFFWSSCILILVSIGFGIALIVNRLNDFKITAQIALRIKNGKRDGIENDRQESKEMGKQTWNYFTIQVSTFLVGFLCLLILVLIEYKDKIT
jgi:hypothetical protein